MADWGFETRQVHAGADPDPATGARVMPIYQTTSFVFRDTAHAAALFGLEELGNIYTRIMNPTQAAFEDRMTALEGGVGALATSSGQAAQTLALLNVAENGGHIVSSASLYGGTYNLLHYTFPKMGIEVSFVDDPDDLDAWRAAVRPNTKLFYGETLGNPKNNVLDIAGVAGVAHEGGVPLMVGNTVPTPVLRRARHRDRRRRGRLRELQLGRARRALPRPHHARPQLPRAQLLGRAGQPGVPDQDPGAAAARPGPGHLPAEQLPAHPGHRDAVAAHGAPRAERAGGRAVARPARRGREGPLRGAAVQQVVRPRAALPAA